MLVYFCHIEMLRLKMPTNKTLHILNSAEDMSCCWAVTGQPLFSWPSVRDWIFFLEAICNWENEVRVIRRLCSSQRTGQDLKDLFFCKTTTPHLQCISLCRAAGLPVLFVPHIIFTCTYETRLLKEMRLEQEVRECDYTMLLYRRCVFTCFRSDSSSTWLPLKHVWGSRQR